MSCEVCKENPAKYKCPGCLMKTCCVSCVNRHKEERHCDGLRNKTAFVSVKSFTENNLYSDYQFLEDVGRRADISIRENREHERRDKARYLHKLIMQARRRHINLKVLPYSFERRKANTTSFWKKNDKIMWRVEWIFPEAGVKYTDNRVPEDKTLEEALSCYLHPTLSDPVIRHRLKSYVSEGMENCTLCLKKEGSQADSPRYHKMDLQKTLTENLKGKQIVEFPTITVLKSSQLTKYNLLQNDET